MERFFLIYISFSLEFFTVPEVLNPKEEGVKITGCSFKYHQPLQGDIYFSILDSNMNIINRITATIFKSEAKDVYKFEPVMLGSYKDLGSFSRCELFDSNDMLQLEFSRTSNRTQFTCKFACY